MIQHDEVPPICYDLLAALHKHSGPMPHRDLPMGLGDIGLLKVCWHRGLIDLVLWHESNHGTTLQSSPNMYAVPEPSCWLSFNHMSIPSIHEAVERDGKCADPKKYLHVKLSRKGDIAFEERRLASKFGDIATRLVSKPTALLSPDLQEVWDLLYGRALPGKKIAAKVCGGPVSEDTIRKRIEAIRRTGRRIKNSPGHGYYRLDAPPSGWTGAERESG